MVLSSLNREVLIGSSALQASRTVNDLTLNVQDHRLPQLPHGLYLGYPPSSSPHRSDSDGDGRTRIVRQAYCGPLFARLRAVSDQCLTQRTWPREVHAHACMTRVVEHRYCSVVVVWREEI